MLIYVEFQRIWILVSTFVMYDVFVDSTGRACLIFYLSVVMEVYNLESRVCFSYPEVLQSVLSYS